MAVAQKQCLGPWVLLILLFLLCYLSEETLWLCWWFCGETGETAPDHSTPLCASFPFPTLQPSVSSHFHSHPSHLQSLQISPADPWELACTSYNLFQQNGDVAKQQPLPPWGSQVTLPQKSQLQLGSLDLQSSLRPSGA